MIHPQQAAAVEFLDAWLASSTQLALLKGYAGTGKTWLMGHWLEQVLERTPSKRIIVMAPTNKALDVLRSKCAHLDVAFCTVDSFLGNRIKKNDDREVVKSKGKGQDAPDLIVCDEGSMIKAEYDRELRNKGAKLLYVGDPAQLPPINELISSVFNIPLNYTLTDVVRFDGSIIKVATMLRNRIESKDIFLLQDVKACREDNSVTFTPLHKVHDWAESAINKGMDVRIVAFENVTVNEHNAVMHERMFPNTPLFGVGEKVVVNETFEVPTGEIGEDGEELVVMLYNGEVLDVTACERAEDIAGVEIFDVSVARGDAEMTLKVARDEGKMLAVHKDLTNRIYQLRREGKNIEVKDLLDLRRPLNDLAPLRHSYSCTVHKSQGSTYDVAIVDWASVFRCQDRARMMYVAATRPAKYLVMAYK